MFEGMFHEIERFLLWKRMERLYCFHCVEGYNSFFVYTYGHESFNNTRSIIRTDSSVSLVV